MHDSVLVRYARDPGLAHQRRLVMPVVVAGEDSDSDSDHDGKASGAAQKYVPAHEAEKQLQLLWATEAEIIDLIMARAPLALADGHADRAAFSAASSAAFCSLDRASGTFFCTSCFRSASLVSCVGSPPNGTCTFGGAGFRAAS